MSPQGLQAQALVKKAKGYDPKRDTRNKSLWKFYQKQAAELTRSGAMPENERSFFSKQFTGMFVANDNPAPAKKSPAARLRAARVAA